MHDPGLMESHGISSLWLFVIYWGMKMCKRTKADKISAGMVEYSNENKEDKNIKNISK